jgi:DNA-binding GntR family transcriptional regulator
MSDYVGPRRELLGSAVTAAVRDQIMNGEISPGDRLALGPLSAKMGMSMTPVREALLLLSQDGWLIHEAHHGFRVAPIDRNDVRDTYLLWATAERELTCRATERLTAPDLLKLRQVDGQLRDLRDHQSDFALTLNHQFHGAIHEIANSAKLVWFANVALRSVPLRFNETFTSVPGWAKINRYGHTPIIDAMEVGDAATAGSLTFNHFIDTGDLLIHQLDELELWAHRPEDAIAGAKHHFSSRRVTAPGL